MGEAGAVLATCGAVVLCVVLGMSLPWWLIGVCLLSFLVWLTASQAGRQTLSITATGLSTLPRRVGGALVTVGGIAGVVGVLVVLMSIGKGFASLLQRTGSNDTAIVLSVGSLNSEISSVLTQSDATIAGEEPQVTRGVEGRPFASPELLVSDSLAEKEGGHEASAAIRGVGPEAWVVHKNAQIIAGRRFIPGLRELIAGKDVVREFANTGLDSTIEINGQPWKVVGWFDSGDAHDSELWGDINVLASTFDRGNNITSVTVRLKNARLFAAYKASLASDPRLKVETHTTRAFYASQDGGLTKMIRILGIMVAAIMAVGAIAGALNSTYAAVSARAREIATLRAIGFRGELVVISLLIETQLLALAGAAIGAAVAWSLFDNYTAATRGTNFSELIFQFRVTPDILANSLRWALVIGLVGGLLPALRAARMSVADGIRS